MERKIKITTLNSFISCKLCEGYLIDATSVTECLHTFCKSCIVKHLEEKNTCPCCDIVIHQSHPLQYISYDRTLQDIVYKLIPDLQQNEIKREKEFYRLRGLPYPKANLEKSLKDNNNSNASLENVNNFNFHREDEQIGIELVSHDVKSAKQIKFPFIRCSSQSTITHLKKFIASHLLKSPEKQKEVDILYNEELLGKDHTLKFVYVTRWRYKRGPMKLYYRISQQLF